MIISEPLYFIRAIELANLIFSIPFHPIDAITSGDLSQAHRNCKMVSANLILGKGYREKRLL